MPKKPDHNVSASSTDFLLVAAHELRTSLGALKWTFDALLAGDYGALSDDQRTLLAKAVGSNQHMLALLTDTLTVLRSDKAVSHYALTPLDFAALILECVEAFQPEAHRHDMDIRFVRPLSPIMVRADAMRLRIVIHNLLENAIKYGRPETDITVALSAKGTAVTFSVQDRGIGIPAQDHDRIFTRFFRAANTRDLPGVGLGLYATRQIVEGHKGTILFESDSSGTTFSVRLPRAR